MRAVVQRVKNATLSVDGKEISKIGNGLIVFLGIKQTDTEKETIYFADKISKLRIFSDENDKLNLSVQDVKGEILLVSNFTLYGATKGTNRPSFILAGRPEMSEPLYNLCAKLLNEKVSTKTGIFGADMQIDVHEDGPITIIMDSEEK